MTATTLSIRIKASTRTRVPSKYVGKTLTLLAPRPFVGSAVFYVADLPGLAVLEVGHFPNSEGPQWHVREIGRTTGTWLPEVEVIS